MYAWMHMLCTCTCGVHAGHMQACCAHASCAHAHAHALPWTRSGSNLGAIWGQATAALEGALERKGWEYEVDEGGGAFYGPKIDIKIKDAIGR